jgi:hypothetical protein
LSTISNAIVQDYAVVSDQEHTVKVFDFKARGRDTQDNWAIGNSPIKTDMVLENLKNYPCKDTVFLMSMTPSSAFFPSLLIIPKTLSKEV